MDAFHGCKLNLWQKKLHGNCRRMRRERLIKSWTQYPTKLQLYVHLLFITETIQVRRTRHAGHCLISGDELTSGIHLWSPSRWRVEAGRPARTYIQQLWVDTGCSLENLPRVMNDRDEWRKRIREIRVGGVTSWDNEIWIYIFNVSLITISLCLHTYTHTKIC